MEAVVPAAMARSDNAAMAIPGEAIHAFWLALTTTSMPQASISNGMAPRPLMPSTIRSGSPGASRTTAAISRSGSATPVEVSLCVTSTARYGAALTRCSRTAAASAASPHSTANRSTRPPNASAIFAKRSPNEPIVIARTRSPGTGCHHRGLERAGSGPGEQEDLAVRADERPASRRKIARCIVANSVPRWSIIGRAWASRTSIGRGAARGCAGSVPCAGS